MAAFSQLWELNVEIIGVDSTPTGRIFSIQTVTLTISKDLWHCGVEINPEVCTWPDTYKCHKLYFLRVFYELGPPRVEHIGKIVLAT